MFFVLVPFSSVVTYALAFHLASAHISSISKAKEQKMMMMIIIIIIIMITDVIKKFSYFMRS